MRLHILVYLTPVYIQMDHLRLFGIGLGVTCHTIREAHTNGNQHVTLLLFQINGIVAMHAQHAHIQRMVRRQRTQSQHGATSRDISFLKKSLQLFLSISQFYSLSHQCQRLFGMINQFSSFAHGIHIQLRISYIRAHKGHLLGFPINLLNLSITGKVEHHRTRTSTACNIERTTDSPRYILGAPYLVRPLRDGLCHTYEVYLLKGIRSQRANSHLPSNHHHRRRVKHGISDTCQGIGSTRATGHQGNPHLTTHSGIALSSMGSCLFVTHQNVVETLLLASRIVEQRIIDGHNAAARVSENSLYPFSLQRPHQRLCSCYSISQHTKYLSLDIVFYF